MSVSVLFVCLGNICRSPLAEAALKAEAERIGLEVEVDSAGTGDWHLGYPPDPRSVSVAQRNGIDISHRRARLVRPEDFHAFDHIIALDLQNLSNLRAIQPEGARAELSLLMDHVPGRQGEPVADPYYGEDSHFDVTWNDVTEGARALAKKLKEQGG